MKDFDHKLALITGGSSGIGLALAKELARHGMRIAILSRRIDVLEQARTEILAACAPEVYTISADVADWQEINSKVSQFIESIGVPDLLVNCAGVVRPGHFEELDMDLFHWMVNTNLMGTIHLCKAVSPGMLARGSGHIVNISSMAGLIGTFGYSAYSASKFGIRGFSDVLRSEYKHRGVHVASVYPPDTDTPQLAGEMPYKPAVTRALSAAASVMKPEAVARDIMRGIQTNRAMIIPGLEGKFLYFLSNLPLRLGYQILDLLVADALKKAEKEKTK